MDKVQQMLPNCPVLAKLLQRFAIILAMQSTQIAACNRLHDVEERLARWLMMSHDRIGGETMPLTQEFLGQMLGTRRASVSIAASVLLKAGMITYIRGQVTILNKATLFVELESTASQKYLDAYLADQPHEKLKDRLLMMVSDIGEEQPDGSRVLTGNQYEIRLTLGATFAARYFAKATGEDAWPRYF